MKTIYLFAATSVAIIAFASSATAEDIKAPVSLKGATIIFEHGSGNTKTTFTIKMVTDDGGTSQDFDLANFSDSKHPISISYKPQGNKAQLCGAFSTEMPRDRFCNHMFGKIKNFSDFDDSKPNFSTITFKSLSGNTYKGTYTGVLINDQDGDDVQKLTNITIILPKK